MKAQLMIPVLFLLVLISFICGYRACLDSTPPCPETLPTAVTDMFTIQNDTLYLKQGVDFVISTKIGIVDSAGIIHRKNK